MDCLQVQFQVYVSTDCKVCQVGDINCSRNSQTAYSLLKNTGNEGGWGDIGQTFWLQIEIFNLL